MGNTVSRSHIRDADRGIAKATRANTRRNSAFTQQTASIPSPSNSSNMLVMPPPQLLPSNPYSQFSINPHPEPSESASDYPPSRHSFTLAPDNLSLTRPDPPSDPPLPPRATRQRPLDESAERVSQTKRRQRHVSADIAFSRSMSASSSLPPDTRSSRSNSSSMAHPSSADARLARESLRLQDREDPSSLQRVSSQTFPTSTSIHPSYPSSPSQGALNLMSSSVIASSRIAFVAPDSRNPPALDAPSSTAGSNDLSSHDRPNVSNSSPASNRFSTRRDPISQGATLQDSHSSRTQTPPRVDKPARARKVVSFNENVHIVTYPYDGSDTNSPTSETSSTIRIPDSKQLKRRGRSVFKLLSRSSSNTSENEELMPENMDSQYDAFYGPQHEHAEGVYDNLSRTASANSSDSPPFNSSALALFENEQNSSIVALDRTELQSSSRNTAPIEGAVADDFDYEQRRESDNADTLSLSDAHPSCDEIDEPLAIGDQLLSSKENPTDSRATSSFDIAPLWQRLKRVDELDAVTIPRRSLSENKPDPQLTQKYLQPGSPFIPIQSDPQLKGFPAKRGASLLLPGTIRSTVEVNPLLGIGASGNTEQQDSTMEIEPTFNPSVKATSSRIESAALAESSESQSAFPPSLNSPAKDHDTPDESNETPVRDSGLDKPAVPGSGNIDTDPDYPRPEHQDTVPSTEDLLRNIVRNHNLHIQPPLAVQGANVAILGDNGKSFPSVMGEIQGSAQRAVRDIGSFLPSTEKETGERFFNNIDGLNISHEEYSKSSGSDLVVFGVGEKIRGNTSLLPPTDVNSRQSSNMAQIQFEPNAETGRDGHLNFDALVETSVDKINSGDVKESDIPKEDVDEDSSTGKEKSLLHVQPALNSLPYRPEDRELPSLGVSKREPRGNDNEILEHQQATFVNTAVEHLERATLSENGQLALMPVNTTRRKKTSSSGTLAQMLLTGNSSSGTTSGDEEITGGVLHEIDDVRESSEMESNVSTSEEGSFSDLDLDEIRLNVPHDEFSVNLRSIDRNFSPLAGVYYGHSSPSESDHRSQQAEPGSSVKRTNYPEYDVLKDKEELTFASDSNPPLVEGYNDWYNGYDGKTDTSKTYQGGTKRGARKEIGRIRRHQNSSGVSEVLLHEWSGSTPVEPNVEMEDSAPNSSSSSLHVGDDRNEEIDRKVRRSVRLSSKSATVGVSAHGAVPLRSYGESGSSMNPSNLPNQTGHHEIDGSRKSNSSITNTPKAIPSSEKISNWDESSESKKEWTRGGKSQTKFEKRRGASDHISGAVEDRRGSEGWLSVERDEGGVNRKEFVAALPNGYAVDPKLQDFQVSVDRKSFSEIGYRQVGRGSRRGTSFVEQAHRPGEDVSNGASKRLELDGRSEEQEDRAGLGMRRKQGVQRRRLSNVEISGSGNNDVALRGMVGRLVSGMHLAKRLVTSN